MFHIILIFYLQDDEVATQWLNDEAVRKAIHADPVLFACSHSPFLIPLFEKHSHPMSLYILQISEAGSWDLCTDRLSFYHDAGSMIKFHRNLTSRGYRALVFRLNLILSEVNFLASSREKTSIHLSPAYTVSLIVDSTVSFMYQMTIFCSNVCSGDHDMCVPFTGSQAWTRSLGYKIVDEWRPWESNGQIAGYLYYTYTPLHLNS